MQLEDLKGMIASQASDYDRMLAEKHLARVRPGDGKAYDALGGLVAYKGARAVPEIVDMAGAVAPGDGQIGADHIQAAIARRYPAEGFQIMADAMRKG